MQNLVGLAYCSRSTSFSFDQVDEILEVACRNNDRDALTGAMLYDNTTFLQWLEGGEEEINKAFWRISRDPRHAEIKLLTVRELEKRWFPDWSMTAAVTNDQTLRSLKLVPHISLSKFAPHAWSDEDVTSFMLALSDFLTKSPRSKSVSAERAVSPQSARNTAPLSMTKIDTPMKRLDQRASRRN